MESINAFCKVMEEITIDIRFLRGLNEDKVLQFKDLLNQLIYEWSDKDYVPKHLAQLFIDFYPSIEALAFMYNDEEKQKILEFADQMTDLMRACLEVSKNIE